ncbi:hypothetical protein FRB94_012718 [Tulasnella sp. JGI-2019a]|nr:hypothetical protein FRB94_012718 [Tulasnella sp. JGI-2019a]
MSNTRAMSDICSPPPIEELKFHGDPNEDVSDFLGSIKRAVVKQGRHLDNEWMVSYAESCLRGDALDWFDEMDPDKVAGMDWSSLRKAFLGRFRATSPALLTAAAAAEMATIAPAGTAVARKQEVPKAPLPATVATNTGGLKVLDASKAGTIITLIAFRADHPPQTLIIGNNGVGKSSLLSRHLGYGWVPSTTPTIDIDFQVHTKLALIVEARIQPKYAL